MSSTIKTVTLKSITNKSLRNKSPSFQQRVFSTVSSTAGGYSPTAGGYSSTAGGYSPIKRVEQSRIEIN
jgi:hypothetical protein